jgi:hypothetical protein
LVVLVFGRLPVADVDLAGHGGGDQGGAAFLEEGDLNFRVGNELINLSTSYFKVIDYPGTPLCSYLVADRFSGEAGKPDQQSGIQE